MITTSGVSGRSREMRPKTTAPPAMLPISTVRKPSRRISGLVAGLMATLPTNRVNTKTPARRGLQPKPTWNINGSRNGVALITKRYTPPLTFPTRNDRRRSASNRSSGCGARRNQSPAKRASAAVTPRPIRNPAENPPAGLITSRETSRPTNTAADKTKPTQSSGATADGRSTGTSRAPATTATSPSGTLITKIQCQLATVRIHPPSAGAMTGASRAGQVRYATTSRRSFFAVHRSTTSRPTGTINAPPRPWRIRLATSIGKVTLAAQSTEATVKTTTAVVKIRRPPNRSVSQPLIGMPAAMVTR